MKLLMITRKVDRTEHLAGFIYNWVKKIASEVDELRVISWQEGDSSGLPDNVKVIHLKTKQNKILKIGNFKKAVWKNIKDVDGVFCHQMPIYTILTAPFAKLYRKKMVSWYMHKQVDWKMKLMEKLTDIVLSASKESFRLPSDKLVVTGHGIDVDTFCLSPKRGSKIFEIISVGRISPTKDYESMIKAVDILTEQGVDNIHLSIVGEPGLESHKDYYDSLLQMVIGMKLQDKIDFLGSRPNNQIPNLLKDSDLFVNLSGTGSLDKAVLEAMACGLVVLTSNESFAEIIPSELMVEKNQPANLASKLKYVIDLSREDQLNLITKMRNEVVKNHNLSNLVKKIVSQFNQ